MGFVAEIIDNVRVSIDRDRNIMLRSVGAPSGGEYRFVFELSIKDKIVAYITGIYSPKLATSSPRTVTAHWVLFQFEPKDLSDSQKDEVLKLIEESLGPWSQQLSGLPLHNIIIERKF